MVKPFLLVCLFLSLVMINGYAKAQSYTTINCSVFSNVVANIAELQKTKGDATVREVLAQNTPDNVKDLVAFTIVYTGLYPSTPTGQHKLGAKSFCEFFDGDIEDMTKDIKLKIAQERFR